MKKLSLFTLALAVSMFVFAQNNPPTGSQSGSQGPLRTPMEVKTRFGIRGGVNLATLELDDDYNATNYNTNLKTSFHVGAFVNVPLTEMFRFQPEVSYVGQGSKVNGTLVSNTANSSNYELDLHYLAVPLMFQLQTTGGFFVELGPQAAFLLSGKEDPASGSKTDLKSKKLIKKTDFGAAGGIGYLSRIGLGANARYVHGFSNVFDSEGAPSNQNKRNFHNRGIQIGLVYHFGANK
ncbi:MAG: PorT family protein [Flavisolibacter sp.]|nr:PorT family protein [Flavisolibacter sp.]MBD0294877.1 PorT family protein [Flavisolibacter sp.]MBD0364760.1 PorT family protein [Flavisolibacter sp.]